MRDNFDTDIDIVKDENKVENNKRNYKIIDKNIKESFRLEELLGKDELEKLKSIL